MITWTVGNDGGTYDYSSINNAFAGIPSSLTDDYTIEVNRNTAGSLVYAENINRGALITTNGYTVKFVGMFGNTETPNSQIHTSGSGSRWQLSNSIKYQHTCVLENFEITATGGHAVYPYYCNQVTVNNCRIHDCLSALAPRAGGSLNGCIIYDVTYGMSFSSNATQAYFNNCIVLADYLILATGNYGAICKDCFIYSSIDLFANDGHGCSFIDCIVLTEGDLFNNTLTLLNLSFSRANRLFLCSNSLMYSYTHGAGMATATDTIADMFGYQYDLVLGNGLVSFDPLINKSGTPLNFATLQSASDLRPENQTLRTNSLYGTDFTPSDIGVYSNYLAPDFPTVADTLTRATTDNVAGEYVPATLSNYLAPNTFGYDDEFTGTYIPDFPLVGNVTLDDTTNGVTGTCVLPGTGDTRSGTGYGEDGTEFVGTMIGGSSGAVGAEAGTLALTGFTSSTVTLLYTAGANFDSGILRMVNRRTGVVSESTLAVGTTVITGLTPDTAFMFEALAYNSYGEFGAVTQPVFVTTNNTALDITGNTINIEWKTERTDWHSYVIGDGAVRVRVPSNTRGYHLKERISTNGQNSRIKVKGLKLHVRGQGPGDMAHG